MKLGMGIQLGVLIASMVVGVILFNVFGMVGLVGSVLLGLCVMAVLNLLFGGVSYYSAYYIVCASGIMILYIIFLFFIR